jgi:hypothetical protein
VNIVKISDLYKNVLENEKAHQSEINTQNCYETDLANNDSIDKLKQVYRRVLSNHDYSRTGENQNFVSYKHTDGNFLEEIPQDFEKILQRTDYGPEDLYKFCEERHIKPEDDYAGIFISSAAEALQEETIKLPDMSEYNQIGYENTKNLHIEGNVGNWLGQNQEGEIHVEGNSGDVVGCGMWGGKITINKDAGDRIGEDMNRGTIEIKGDAGESIGKNPFNMQNSITKGEIILHGEGNFPENPATKIYKQKNGSRHQLAP